MLYGKSEHVKRVERGHPAKVGRKKGSTKEILEQKRIEKLLKGERTPYQQDIMILGMMERKGRLILKKLGRSKQCVTNENIHPHLQKHITKNSVLITDQWGGYQTIGKEYKSHLFVNHKETFVKNRAYTNNVEGVWNHFKRVILGTYFHMSFHHFDNYLDEFTFRWNRRNENGAVKFEDFMKSFEGRRLKYQDLISKNVEPLKTAA
jgi:transposase-like protein